VTIPKNSLLAVGSFLQRDSLLNSIAMMIKTLAPHRRDMGDTGSVLVREKDVGKHRKFNIDLFRRGDGNWQIKLVLSSYTFMNNGAMGIPDGKSDCAKCVGS
jgi:hypothetical protein